MKLTIENLNKCLSKIDYKLKGVKPNRFIFDHKNKNTGIRVWNESIDFRMESGISASALMNKCSIKILGKNTVMIGDNKLFVLLHNFDKI